MTTRRDGLLILCCTVVMLSWFYGRTLLESREFLFRDSLYYHSLFKYVHQEFEAGRFPLWNPYDNSGTPLAANPTACVFYPGKFLFQLPLSFETNFLLFIMLHSLLAVGSMYRLSRALSLSPLGSGLAGLCYAASGSVLFQHTNLVFLIGAAWLPLGLMFGLQLITTPAWKSSLGLSTVLALMVVGGDPQTAYHLGLLLGLATLMQVRLPETANTPQASSSPELPAEAPQSKLPAEAPQSKLPVHSFWHRVLQVCSGVVLGRLFVLGKAASVAALLASVQIWLTSDFSAQTTRAMSEVPENIWEIPEHLIANRPVMPRPDTGQEPHWYDTLIGNPPQPAKHYLQRYSFSFEPYRVVEFLFPHFSGQLQPFDTRWTRNTGWESENIWQPTIYMGLIPFVLMLSALPLARREKLICWLVLIAAGSLFASFGRYGVGWLFHEISAALGGKQDKLMTGGEVGGLYWLLVSVLPKYASFRFPAKWLVITTLAIALLAAKGLDHISSTQWSERTRRSLMNLSACVMFLWIVNLAVVPFLQRFVAGSSVRASFVVCGTLAIFSAMLVIILRFGKSIPASEQKTDSSRHNLKLLTVLLCTFELMAFNGSLITSYPAGELSRTLWLQQIYQTLFSADDDKQIVSPRIHVPFQLTPEGHQPFNAHQELAGVPLSTGHKRDIMGMTSNLPNRVPLVFNYGTMISNSYEAMFDMLPLPQFQAFLNPRHSLDAWNAEYFILPNNTSKADPEQSTLGLLKQWTLSNENDPLERLVPIGEPLPEVQLDAELSIYPNITIVKNTSAFDRCWLVEDAKYIEHILEKERIKWLRLLGQMTYPMAAPIDLKTTAVIEVTPFEPIEPLEPLNRTNDPFYVPESESCRIIRYEPNHIELDVSSQGDRWLILAEAYDKGWTAKMVVPDVPELNRPLKVYRANRCMRGLFIGPGQCRIVIDYRPIGFTAGLPVSIVTMLLTAIAAIMYWLRDRRRASRMAEKI